MAHPFSLARSVGVALVAALAAPAWATSPPPLPTWLAGRWDGDGRSAGVTEAWTNGRIGRLLGIGQTLRGARGSFEFMQITTAADAALVLVAQPGGRPPVVFRAVTVEPARIVFANPAHDAPRTIEYRRDGERLTVYLDAPAGAAPSFTFRRTACDTQFAAR
jgi:hypothetical protein